MIAVYACACNSSNSILIFGILRVCCFIIKQFIKYILAKDMAIIATILGREYRRKIKRN